MPISYQCLGIIEREKPRHEIFDESFIVKDYFKLKTEGGIFSKISDRFHHDFIDMTEEFVYKRDIKVYRLVGENIACADAMDIGWSEMVYLWLYDVFYLVSLQSNGESGKLSLNAPENIFFVKTELKGSRVIVVSWSIDGFEIDSFPVDSCRDLQHACRVFMRSM